MANNEALFIDVFVSDYCTSDAGDTLTVGQLIRLLKVFDKDTPVYIRETVHNYCAYGAVTEDMLSLEEDESNDDDDEDEDEEE